MLLNQLQVLDSDCVNNIRAHLGNPLLQENFGKPRGKVTQALPDSDAGNGLRAASFQLGDTLITGSDRREWVKAKELRNREKNTVISSIILLARPDSPLYSVLLEACRKSKNPNALIEAAEHLFNAPSMVICQSLPLKTRRSQNFKETRS